MTYSTISIQNLDGTIESVLCIYDGYIKNGVGETLLNNYKTRESVLALIDGGTIEALCDSISQDDEESTVFRSSMGEDHVSYWHPSMKDYEKTFIKEPYNYMFIDGVWFVDRISDGFNRHWENLEAVLKSLQ